MNPPRFLDQKVNQEVLYSIYNTEMEKAESHLYALNFQVFNYLHTSNYWKAP